MTLASALNGLSSLSALSISQPEAIAGLVALGIVAAGVGIGATVVIVHKKWEHYEEKKHREEIDDVNRRYKRFLEKIEVPGYGVIQGFPPIFKFGPDKDSKSVDSLHYTVDEVKDLSTNLPRVDPILSSYRQSILSAILKLQEYYLSREDHNDVTAGVLSYLLNILRNKCLCFEGYENDSAYLSALTDFIDDYASKENRENSQHFKRLQPVYSYLLDAKQQLEKHKEALSLRELVDELRSVCIEDSNKLLRLLVKMVVAEKDKELVNTVALDELRDNLLRRHYIKTEKWGVVFTVFPEINLPDSIFKEWINRLAKYYLGSLAPSSILKEKSAMPPGDLYAFTDWAQSILQQKRPTHRDKEKLHQILSLIHSVFKNSHNFINTKLAGTEKKPEFVVVQTDQEILNRTVIMANFAHLIHAIISLQAFCSHLLHSIEQLGAIYVNDPAHFTEIFTVLDGLCKVVEADLKKNKNAFIEIERANKNTMRLAKEGLFSKEIEVVLESVEHMLLKLGAQVKDYKNKHTESSATATQEAVYEMLTVAHFFEKMYQVTQESNEKNTPADPCSPKDKVPCPQTQCNETGSQLEEPTLDESSTQIIHMETVLNELSNQTNNRITVIKKEQPTDPKWPKYQIICNMLRALQINCIEMLNEREQNDERMEKADKTYNLIISLYQKTLDFLSLSQEERTKQAGVFIQKIHAELNSPENSKFIDKHRDNFSKFLYEHLGFFHTKTRNQLFALEQAYDVLSTNNNS